VRAQTIVDTGDWSNIKSIKIDIQDFPYFDLSYQLPENNAVGVSKTPVLGWKAEDPDGDTLYYDLFIGNRSKQFKYRIKSKVDFRKK
jgi:hypothetical protein